MSRPPNAVTPRHSGDGQKAARASESAMALLPGLTYLARTAHEAGLETVHSLITEALTGVLQWIEEESDERPAPKDCH